MTGPAKKRKSTVFKNTVITGGVFLTNEDV
jgi:hypothetical protein